MNNTKPTLENKETLTLRTFYAVIFDDASGNWFDRLVEATDHEEAESLAIREVNAEQGLPPTASTEESGFQLLVVFDTAEIQQLGQRMAANDREIKNSPN